MVQFACLLLFSLSPKSTQDLGRLQIQISLQNALDSASSNQSSESDVTTARRHGIPVLNYEEGTSSSLEMSSLKTDDDGKKC